MRQVFGGWPSLAVICKALGVSCVGLRVCYGGGVLKGISCYRNPGLARLLDLQRYPGFFGDRPRVQVCVTPGNPQALAMGRAEGRGSGSPYAKGNRVVEWWITQPHQQCCCFKQRCTEMGKTQCSRTREALGPLSHLVSSSPVPTPIPRPDSCTHANTPNPAQPWHRSPFEEM